MKDLQTVKERVKNFVSIRISYLVSSTNISFSFFFLIFNNFNCFSSTYCFISKWCILFHRDSLSIPFIVAIDLLFSRQMPLIPFLPIDYSTVPTPALLSRKANELQVAGIQFQHRIYYSL